LILQRDFDEMFLNQLFAKVVAEYPDWGRKTALGHSDVVVCLDPDEGPQIGTEGGPEERREEGLQSV
jgi:hypothetical protein